MLQFYVSADIFKTVSQQVDLKSAGWPEARECLQLLFGKVKDQAALLREFHQRVQGESEPVQIYLVALRKIAHDIVPELDGTAFVTKFVSGLREETRRLLKCHSAAKGNIIDIVKAVKEFEAEFPTKQAQVATASADKAMVNRVEGSQRRPVKFEGQCWSCGQFGHKERHCQSWLDGTGRGRGYGRGNSNMAQSGQSWNDGQGRGRGRGQGRGHANGWRQDQQPVNHRAQSHMVQASLDEPFEDAIE